MSTIDPKVIAVAAGIRQSIEQNAGPGSSVNSHPNPFFVNVTGSVDLYKAAEAALSRAAQFEASVAAAFEFDIKKVATKLIAELTEGATSIEDAFARIKAKAGGEIQASAGVIEAATARVEKTLAPVL
jgi:hypothetical protein